LRFTPALESRDRSSFMGFSAVFLVFATGTWDLNCEVWGGVDVRAKYARNPALQGHIPQISTQINVFEIME
jgi:hypothetical protein